VNRRNTAQFLVHRALLLQKSVNPPSPKTWREVKMVLLLPGSKALFSVTLFSVITLEDYFWYHHTLVLRNSAF
jgi:hypothetical protein